MISQMLTEIEFRKAKRVVLTEAQTNQTSYTENSFKILDQVVNVIRLTEDHLLAVKEIYY